MIYELNHFGIVVRDLDASLAFYRDVLGARVVFEGHIPVSDTAVRYLQIGGGMIELLGPAEHGADTEFGITHVAFLTDDLDADWERLGAAGAAALVPPKTAGTGVGRLGFVGDPSGLRVELIQRDVKMRDGFIGAPFVKSLDHYSIHVKDATTADFYRDALGLTQLHAVKSSVYLHYDYDVLEVTARPDMAESGAFAHVALRVDSVPAALEAVTRIAGDDVIHSPARASAYGSGEVAAIRDPDGVVIEFLDRPDLRDA